MYFQIGCFVIVFAWLSLALFLRKSPSFGSRIIMFTTVFASFLKVLPFIMIFLVAYSLGFYMCLGDEVSISYLYQNLLLTKVVHVPQVVIYSHKPNDQINHSFYNF